VVRNDLFKRLSERGTLLTNYKAIAHPSQPNYLGTVVAHQLSLLESDAHLISSWVCTAITSGNDWSVSDAPVNLNTRNIVDLLEAKVFSLSLSAPLPPLLSHPVVYVSHHGGGVRTGTFMESLRRELPNPWQFPVLHQ
jgi:hypothetical protein